MSKRPQYPPRPEPDPMTKVGAITGGQVFAVLVVLAVVAAFVLWVATAPPLKDPGPSRASDPAAELAKDTPLRKTMIRAAEHLPAGASLEEVTAQAQAEEATAQIAQGEAKAREEIAEEEAGIPQTATPQQEQEGREWRAAHPDGEP